MNRIKIFALTLVALLFSGAVTVHAQDYKSAVGLNIGTTMGVNIKQFLGEKSAIEGTFGYQYKDKMVMTTVAYQYHIKLVSTFKFYVGGGVNLGAEHVNNKYKLALGIAPNVGFEYKFKNAPIALGLDYMPQLDFFRGANWELAMLKLRFCF